MAMNLPLEDVRRAVTYHPTIWGDYFLAYTSDVTCEQEISEAEKQELEKQKKMVTNLLAQTPDDSFHKLDLIDAIQRLGVAYHFENEIDTFLQNIHDTFVKYDDAKADSNDLRVVALRFRLLRQNGYNIPCDVLFNKFLDKEGNFKESLKDDINGMLSLFEAAHFGVRGEEILDKALEFSSSRLTESLLPRVNEALKNPIRKSVIRLAAKKFISMYQDDDSHDETLLNFAKLDFNIVQKIHQKELSELSRWYKALDFTNKLPFARDRFVECYLWIVAVYFEPQLNVSRKILTKVIYVTSMIDDIYDVYGKLNELQLFTEFIQRWDEDDDLEQLNPYMRICYKALLDVYSEMEKETGKTGTSWSVQYAKEDMKKLVRAYMEEAKWFYSKHTPTMEEYMKVAVPSGAYMMLSTTSLVGMGGLVTKRDFDWVSGEPLIVRASAIICRLMNDLVGYEFESKLSAIHCYMNENGGSKMDAFAELEE
ncbi:Trehalose-6-P synthase/phosphatase complex synthase subunit [Castilleja foliolosa]|uniref:Trehalose-6-P synthase/phosphatase complex synthase subunit n=1 Tax=Castilleja foliolosa TaxID=1961234 RepID=A0ABD3EEA2_9LAMI